MTIALALGLLLLLVAGALTLWQRRAQVDFTAPRGLPASAGPPSAGRDVSARPAATGASRHDPDFGPMTWDGEMWSCEEDIQVAGHDVSLEVAGPAAGPEAASLAVAQALRTSSADIDARARPMVVAELQRRGCPPEDPVPYEAAVGPTDAGRLAGWLWYCFGEFSGEIGVRSEDHWRTLTLEVLE